VGGNHQFSDGLKLYNCLSSKYFLWKCNTEERRLAEPPPVKNKLTCILQLLVGLFLGRQPQWARASPFTRFLDYTLRRTTAGRTPLDEWSARRRDPVGIRTHKLRHLAQSPSFYQPFRGTPGFPGTHLEPHCRRTFHSTVNYTVPLKDASSGATDVSYGAQHI
jgi:hypothetical protein